jgi:PAS domain S-box-containing protein
MSSKLSASLVSYLIAIAVTTAAVLLRLLLDPILGNTLVLVTLYGAVGISAWYGGFRPALLSSLSGYAICNFLFIEPRGSLSLDSIQAVGFAAYMFTCGIILGLGARARAAESRFRMKESEHSYVEQELRNNEQNTRIILESITDSFLTLDHEWRFSYLNPAAERLLGRPSSDLIGKIVWEQYPDAIGSEIETIYRKVIAEQAPASLTTYYSAHERWYDLRVYPAAAGLSVYFRDVTNNKMSETALQLSEERRRLALDSAELGAWNIDIATRVMSTDERFIYIFTGSNSPLSYEEAVEAIHPDDRDRIIHAVNTAIDPNAPAPYSEEYRVVHPDGSIHWVFAKGRPNFEGEGEYRRLVSFDGTISDITARKRGEELLHKQTIALAEESKRKNEFLATLAHELRNPLSPVRNVLEIMKLKNLADPQINWAMEVLDRQLKQLTHLVDDLLDVSRITQGRFALRKTILSFNQIVINAIETVKPCIDAASQTLVTEIPNDTILLEADPTRVTQIVSNLLNNASKYTPANGVISVRVSLVGEQVILSIKDNGIGIEENQLTHIFQMFSQLTPALERSGGGLGIGLALVKGLVELHQGTVEAFSQGLGKGSEFIVTIPLNPSITSQPYDETNIHADNTVIRKVLLIDDNKDIADTMSVALELLGHEVRTANDGPQGILLGDEYKPDIVLLDIGLPGMNGFEVARRIRATDWGKNVYLVAATGWGQPQDKLKAAEAGFDQHLTKPIEFEALADAINKSLE